jgi:hypothetical protein
MKITACLAIVTALTMQLAPVAHARGVSANLFGCPRDCGLFRATMHTGTPGTADCRESCSWFPLLAFFRDCGGCDADESPTAPSPNVPSPTFPSPPFSSPTPPRPPSSTDPYNIKMVASGVPNSDFDVILGAANRWTNVIVNGLSDVSTTGLAPLASRCPYPEVVDDLFICIVYGTIDGPGGTLGSALVDTVRTSNGLPIGGYFFVDSADVSSIKADGTFASVFAHEIGHLLGTCKRLTDDLAWSLALLLLIVQYIPF